MIDHSNFCVPGGPLLAQFEGQTAIQVAARLLTMAVSVTSTDVLSTGFTTSFDAVTGTPTEMTAGIFRPEPGYLLLVPQDLENAPNLAADQPNPWGEPIRLLLTNDPQVVIQQCGPGGSYANLAPLVPIPTQAICDQIANGAPPPFVFPFGQVKPTTTETPAPKSNVLGWVLGGLAVLAGIAVLTKQSTGSRPNPAGAERSGGFSISTYSQDLIEDNARDLFEEGGTFREEALAAGMMNVDGEITVNGWKTLNADVRVLDRNAMRWLKRTFNSARDEGHAAADDLVGTFWYDPSNKDQMEAIDMGIGERIDMIDASYGDLAHTAFDDVSDFGAWVLGGQINFMDVITD